MFLYMILCYLHQATVWPVLGLLLPLQWAQEWVKFWLEMDEEKSFTQHDLTGLNPVWGMRLSYVKKVFVMS